jgi:hypothetical protein
MQTNNHKILFSKNRIKRLRSSKPKYVVSVKLLKGEYKKCKNFNLSVAQTLFMNGLVAQDRMKLE